MIAEELDPRHFYKDAHRTIYTAMIHLYERHHSYDQFSISDHLDRQEKLEDAGGEFYIGMLIERAFECQDVLADAEKIIDTWTRRQLMETSQAHAYDAYHAETAAEAIENAEERIYAIAHRKTTHEIENVGDVFTEEFNELLKGEQIEGAIRGVPTGLHGIDGMTGGFQKSDLLILAGRPAMGKTSLMLSIARNASMDYGQHVLIFSLEMAKKQLIQRLTAHEARVDLHRLRMRQLNENEQERVINVSGSILDASIRIDDTPGLSLAGMRSRIRREMAQHEVDLVVVDYLGKMTATIDGKRIRERYQEVSEIARGLKDMAREFDIPVLALSQLNRAVEGRADKIPQMSDLRESGEIEQEADVIIFIHRDDYYAGKNDDGTSKSNRPDTADIVFSKHRNGPIGDILLGFEDTQTRFSNLGEK